MKISKKIITKYKLLFLSAVVVFVLAVSSVGVYALANHNKRVFPVRVAGTSSPNTTTTPQPISTSTTQLPSTAVTTNHVATPKPTASTVGTPTPTPQPVITPTILPPSISFSIDGCYVPATGSPGMILSGSV